MAAAAAATTRRLRAFRRWMRSQGIDCSDALDLIDHQEEGISVKTRCDLHEGDLVATIPKQSCLTIRTSGARHLIEAAGLEGYLGLSVALMYEKSLGYESPWFGYLQLLPESECIPLLWTSEEVDSLLLGTELHKIIKEDKAHVYEDWKECILPLMATPTLELNPNFFGVENYCAAKSLIASRSFEIDDYYGFGMVPLADLFNHKTGAEDVHFTSVSSHLSPENDSENQESDDCENNDDVQDDQGSDVYEDTGDGDDPTVLEMIIVKDVKSGLEVFNTYGFMGNAALLHRYGFTEADNPYNIVNIDLELVLEWSSTLFSCRHSRVRSSLWRRLEYSGCVSQNSEYFEISSNGEPQVELLILLYILLLPEEAYNQLDLTASTMGNLDKPLSVILPKVGDVALAKAPEMSKDLLLTKAVCDALLLLANLRESFYGSNSIEDDVKALKRCCRFRERKLYNSCLLRVCERRILEELRAYASAGGQSSRTVKRASTRKELKRS